ncbi:type 1 glutamine amidotransferase [Sulfurisphaera ohwakuensis]|uniref:GMP synthase n=1 Tax=Sulfurisphaera ohwakuensis TaxID=69656 RepID=A0A650CG79_SULOH|nr:type 1 glutamine amidotransferase [Sulfurisphaera ohwakuensis]MBB5255143.1 GMP synthase-like glutamine amidotransferase [Sulfurisphaera ohwakuensis]QGR16779.1 GMP synthase [Sulfurisphaera ohwakuensis]
MEKLLVIQNHEVEKLGTFEQLLKGHYTIKTMFADELKGNEDFDALMILGGPQAVYEKDKYKYIELEIELVRKALRENKRILGISLGAQIMSYAAGGSVTKGSFGPEFGIIEINLVNGLENVINSKSMNVFLWHRDTFTIPPEGTLLGYSNKYFQIYKVKRGLGMQFHIEIDEEEINEWFNAYRIVDSDIIHSSNNSIRIEELKNNVLLKIKELKNEFHYNLKKIIEYWLSL